MSISKKILIFSSLFFCFSSYARVTVTGDANAAAGKSLSFYVLPSVGFDNVMYVGRSSNTDNASADSIRQYSLSGFRAGNSVLTPFAPARVFLNGQANQPNPLIGQKISCLGVCNELPLIVCSDSPTDLYLINSTLGSADVAVYSKANLKDAQGATNSDGSTTAGIIRTTGSRNFIFAATKKSGSTFGVAGSGIALLTLGKDGLVQQPAVWSDSGIKSVPFNATLSDLVIGNPALMAGAVLDMYWDDQLQRLYIVAQITGGTDAADGVVGIMMGYLEEQEVTTDGQKISYVRLRLAPVVDKTLFTGTNTIVGAVAANSVVTLYKVRVMHTTTGCSYLIVVGNGTGAGPDKCVYALPLVNKRPTLANSTEWSTNTGHGVLASKVVQPGTNLKTYYDSIGSIRTVRGRGFQQAATTLADLPVDSDAAAKVGAGVTIGSIQNISVYKDAVFVSVASEGSETSGVFHSQPLFDGDGAIKGWTPWKRVISASDTTTNYYGIHYSPAQGKMFALQGASDTTVDTLLTTTWGNGSSDGVLGGTTSDATVGLNSLLTTAFADCGGMQGLFDFPKETLGFTTTLGSRTSLMVATGYKKIVIVRTGSDNDDDIFIPQVGSFVGTDNKVFTEGSLDSSLSADTVMITMSGGALDTLGAITTAVVVKTNSTGSYMVLGGTGGLATLRQFNRNGSTRRGWTSDLTKTFSPLHTSFRWELLGTYSNIKKLTHDGQNLYILTPTRLERLPFSQLFAVSSAVSSSTIATPASLGLSPYASFADVVVSGDLALLGTSQGLYATGVGGVVSTATTTSDPLWRKISFSEGPAAVTQLFPLSSTRFVYDVAKNTVGGMVDVLATSVSQNLASIYRFAIADATAGVTSTTIRALPDGVLSSVVGPYAHIGSYKNHYTTDGGLPLFSANQYAQHTNPLMALSADLTFGVAILGKVAREPRIIPFAGDQIGTTNGFVHASATGSLIFVTPSGLHTLE